MKVFEGARVPIKSWCEAPEEGALNQARNLAALPFIFKHVALMPDTHQGYGMPIGGVVACEGVIIPNAVGVDIGCGMSCIKTPLTVDVMPTARIKEVMGKIRALIPVGFNHHKVKQDWSGFSSVPDVPIVKEQLEAARYQLGTLGGGNHFIEIQKDPEGFVWVMVHSGSRNFGLKIASHYNKKAQELNAQWFSSVPFSGNDGLAFLPVDSEDGAAYIEAMNFACEFSFANRAHMIGNILSVLDVEPLHYENIHHNYAKLEHHFGRNVWVHRKGATSAREGEIGIIPGSQGTKSYIVSGKGSADSFTSCSHGAGRRMSRTEARKTLNLQAEIDNMNNLGIVHGIRSEADLDEAASAYKDIDAVMLEQSDLVDVVTTLTPMAVIKG